MGDSILVPSILRGELYRELGEPAADMPNVLNGTLDDKLNSAARRVLAEIAFARDGKSARLGEFTTVANQQTYPVPDEREIVKIFWGPSSVVNEVAIDPFANQFGNIPGSSLAGVGTPGFIWQSDRVIGDIRRQQAQNRWSAMVLDGLIYLYPVPGAVGLVKYLYYMLTGALTDLTLRHRDAVLHLATALCCRVMANRLRGRGTTYTEEGINASDKSQDWLDNEARYMDDFRRDMAEITSGVA